MARYSRKFRRNAEMVALTETAYEKSARTILEASVYVIVHHWSKLVKKETRVKVFTDLVAKVINNEKII